MWHDRNGDCCALAGVGKCKCLGMFAWSTTLKYIVRKQYICKSRAFVNEFMLCMFPASLVVFCVTLTTLLRVLGRSNSYLTVCPCHEHGVSSPMLCTVVTAYIILHIETVSTTLSSFVIASPRLNSRNGDCGALAGVESASVWACLRGRPR